MTNRPCPARHTRQSRRWIANHRPAVVETVEPDADRWSRLLSGGLAYARAGLAVDQAMVNEPLSKFTSTTLPLPPEYR